MTSIRTAMILAAGKGSRLAPLTNDIPKPLLDIHGKPLIVHQLNWLRQAGVTRVVINLFHLGQQIRAELGDGKKHGLEIVYSEEAQLLETGGGIAHARPLLGEAPFFLLNGDIWTNFDFARLPQGLAPHLDGHLMVVPTPPNRERGDFKLAHHRLWRPTAQHERNWVYCGIAVLRPAIIGSRQGVFSLRDSLFEAADQGKLAGSPLFLPPTPEQSGSASACFWNDIGTLDQLIEVRNSAG